MNLVLVKSISGCWSWNFLSIYRSLGDTVLCMREGRGDEPLLSSARLKLVYPFAMGEGLVQLQGGRRQEGEQRVSGGRGTFC